MANVVAVLRNSTQKILNDWKEKIQNAIETTQEERKSYVTKKEDLLPQLIEASKKGVSSRELERITGINHATICRWIREAKKQEGSNVSS